MIEILSLKSELRQGNLKWHFSFLYITTAEIFYREVASPASDIIVYSLLNILSLCYNEFSVNVTLTPLRKLFCRYKTLAFIAVPFPFFFSC